MAAFRVALVGYGVGGAVFHAPLIAATSGLRLAVIVTADPGRRAAADRAFPGVPLLDRAERLLAAADEFDLVVVAAPNRAHAPLALAALDAGCAVVVDKPLAVTAAEAGGLVARAAETGQLLTVFHNRRFDGDFRTVRRLLATGELGTVTRFESRFERWRPQPRAGSWRERAAPAEGGGILFDLGSHLIDQALVLFGRPDSVYAEVDHRREGVEADDDVFVALTHPGGVPSHLWASAVSGSPGPRFRLLGSRAAYVSWGLDPQEETLRAGGRPGDAGFGQVPEDRWGRLGAGPDTRPVPTLAGTYPAFYSQLVTALRDGGPPPVDPADAVLGLDIIAAARRSATEGVVVAVR